MRYVLITPIRARAIYEQAIREDDASPTSASEQLKKNYEKTDTEVALYKSIKSLFDKIFR